MAFGLAMYQSMEILFIKHKVLKNQKKKLTHWDQKLFLIQK